MRSPSRLSHPLPSRLVKRRSTAAVSLLFVAVAALLLAGCSTLSGEITSDNTAPPVRTTTSTTAPTSTEADADVLAVEERETRKPSTTVTAAQVVSTLEGMGFECGTEDAMTMCYNDSGENWQVRTSPVGDGDRGYLKAACAAGAADDGRVLTNRTSTVVYAGNPGQDLHAFKRRLASSGIALDLVDYC